MPFLASAGNSKGGLLAMAGDMSTETDSCTSPPCATVWAIAPQPSSVSGGSALGALFGYSITFGSVSLSNIYYWITNTDNSTHCSSPPIAAWFPPAFAEPTLANGAVYVPTLCAVTGDTGTYGSCTDFSTNDSSKLKSGMLQFGPCS
jgi:hypothetical protein